MSDSGPFVKAAGAATTRVLAVARSSRRNPVQHRTTHGPRSKLRNCRVFLRIETVDSSFLQRLVVDSIGYRMVQRGLRGRIGFSPRALHAEEARFIICQAEAVIIRATASF